MAQPRPDSVKNVFVMTWEPAIFWVGRLVVNLSELNRQDERICASSMFHLRAIFPY